MKKNGNNNLLLEIIRHNAANTTNQLKNNTLYLVDENVTAVELGEIITFLDTPGHSDFIKMRQRGISLTDIVVLVIDAKDGIMSQTSEIIDYLREHELPVIVFINHKNPSQTNHPANLHKLTAQLQAKGLDPLAIINGNAKK